MTRRYILMASSALAIAAAGMTIRPGEGWTPLSGETHVREGSALDFSGFGAKRTPAGSLGRVVARGAHFEFEQAPGVPQRFYGVNFCFTGNFMSADEAEELCTRLERVGYNAIRIHHYEKVLCEGAADGTTINPKRMAELDNLLNAAIRHGLYVTTDLYVSRQVPYRSCGIDRDGVIPMNEFKELVLCHEGVRSNLVAFTKALLGHVNPATGRRWADEPALMSISLVNENNPGNHGFAFLRKTLGVTAEQMPDKRFEELVAGKLGAFDREMIRVLKEEIGYRGLVTGLNGWHNAPCHRDLRKAYDYVDDHFYVDHPKFLEKPWRLPSECRNANPIIYWNAGIDWYKERNVRRADRPYTITEWNFSGPGRYRGAGGIVFGAGAALQEMDGVWRFAWSHSHDRLLKDGKLTYFDAAVDPLMLATERAIIALYLRGDMPADRKVRKPTDPCRWLTADRTNGTFTIATPRTAGVFAEPSDRTYRMGPLQVAVKGHSAAVWATSLDGRPLAESRHLLVTHVTDVQDVGTVYRAADRKVLEKWGDLPHLMANGTAEIALDTSRTLKVYALRADGTRLGEVKASGKGLAFTADVARDPKAATYLYEIVEAESPKPLPDSLFRDGFVFSSVHPTRVAGRAVAGSEVTVKALGKTVRTKAGADGRFSAELPALGVRKTPFTVEVTDSAGTTTISDCLSGLVLLAAGQSNMEVPVKETLDPEQEIAAANFPQIREFKVEHDFDFAPRTSCSGQWTAVTPQTAAEIGAIGYYTARRLQKELDGIPVGIVNNSYSATSIQPWLPLEILQAKHPGSLGTYKKFSPLGHDGVIKRREELGKSFLVQDPGNKGEEQGWHRGAAGADWKDVKMPCFLDYEVYGEATDGAFWVVRTFVAPDDFLDKDVEFRATAIDDYDTTYVNGVKIGATGEETPDSYDMPRGYRIRKGLLKKGENTIAIRIFDTAHAGGIPPGATLALAYGEKEFSLAGLWKTKAELVIPSKPWPPDYLPLVKIYHVGSVLYNAMFLPVSGVPYDAMLWYQGESNAGQRTYGDMLDDLITRWRADVGQPDVPFVVMQLASFTARPKSAADTGAWPLTRQHQAEARKLPNVRLVPTIDIGDANRIHPLDKQEVGRRTALVLLQDFWAKDRFAGAVAYPELTKVIREGQTLVVELKDAKGLRTTDGRAPQGFSVTGPADPKTRKAPAAWAKARIDGEKIVVEIPSEIASPVCLRYAWHMNPDINTVNGLGFPLLPFEQCVSR